MLSSRGSYAGRAGGLVSVERASRRALLGVTTVFLAIGSLVGAAAVASAVPGTTDAATTDAAPADAATPHPATPSRVGALLDGMRYITADGPSTGSAAGPPTDTRLRTCTAEYVQLVNSFRLTCDDESAHMDGVTWLYWGDDKAIGLGTSHRNTCDPTCAEGERSSEPAVVVLDRPVRASIGHPEDTPKPFGPTPDVGTGTGSADATPAPSTPGDPTTSVPGGEAARWDPHYFVHATVTGPTGVREFVF